MSGAISATTIAALGIGAAGSIGGAALASHAAGKAADAQTSAADRAAQLQYQASQDSLDFQKQQYAQNRSDLMPWLQTGTNGLSQLSYMLGLGGNQPQGATSPGMVNGQTSFSAAPGQLQLPSGTGNGFTDPRTGLSSPIQANSNVAVSQPIAYNMDGSATAPQQAQPGSSMPLSNGSVNVPQVTPGAVNPNLGSFGSLMAPNPYSTFTAPDNLTEQNDPGFQARLKLSTDAMQKSAAARGNLLTGGFAKGLNQFAQDYASNEYGNVYNRAYNTHAANYNAFNQNQTNQFNRLAAIAGVGQQTAGELSTLGQNTANSVSNNLISTANNMGQQYNNAAAATASGYVGGANAWNQALGGMGGNLSNLLLLQKLGGSGGGFSGLPVSNGLLSTANN